MDNREAIERIKWRILTASNIAGKGADGKAYEDLEIAIHAMEELEQYRAIGTVEELKAMKEAPMTEDELKEFEMLSDIVEQLQQLEEYKLIGTIEQVRVAVERMKPKKPFGGMYNWTCPTCGTYHSTHGKCCSECMQVILWD